MKFNFHLKRCTFHIMTSKWMKLMCHSNCMCVTPLLYRWSLENFYWKLVIDIFELSIYHLVSTNYTQAPTARKLSLSEICYLFKKRCSTYRKWLGQWKYVNHTRLSINCSNKSIPRISNRLPLSNYHLSSRTQRPKHQDIFELYDKVRNHTSRHWR